MALPLPKKEIEMNFAFWLPVLFSLGIVALAGFVLVLAAVDNYGPSLFQWLRFKGQGLGGSHSSRISCVLKH